MNQPLQHIPEFRDVDAEKFRREIATLYRPAVLKGLVAQWPAVRHGTASPQAMSAYLNAFDNGGEVEVVMAPARVKGRLFYDETMEGFNFTRNRQTIGAVNEQLLRFEKFDNRPMVAAQSALISACIPGFADENRLAIVHDSVAPRIWLGNAVVTPAHFDESNNIACVVSGRRRFTLLPPEQIANLYPGPLGHAPTGTPISLVSFREPDFARFPRFREALANALVAELEPGDALYIPTLWWHHVESLTKYNVLINYWWKGASDAPGKPESALDPLLHCLLNLNYVAPEHRQAWAAIFNHYVFHAQGDPAEQIPEKVRGMLGTISPELEQQVRAFLVGKLRR